MPTEKPNVLIAEDNPGLARVLSFKFKSSGFTPVSCGNGGEAWKSFCEGEIAAIVSDHEMPIMSGIELIQRVRATDENVPCFLVTGRQLELSRDPRIAELNIQEVFGKPFSPGTVVSAVGDAIRHHQAATSAPIAPVLNTSTTTPQSGVSGAGA